MELKSVSLKEFRNIPSLTLQFDKNTEIRADNGWGKSNIADAISWVLTGTLLDGSSDIESIKPKHNRRALVEVEIEFTSGTKLKKTYQEYWVKTRGTTNEEFKGHTSRWFINDLEYTFTKYEDELKKLLTIDMEWLHILIDPTYFGLKLDWKQRRKIVNHLVGEVTIDDVLNNNPQLEPIRQLLMTYNGKVDMAKKKLLTLFNTYKAEEKDVSSKIEGLTKKPTPILEADYQHGLKRIADIEQQIVQLNVKRSGLVNTTLESLKAKLNETIAAYSKQVQEDSSSLKKLNEGVVSQAEGIRSKITKLSEEKAKLDGALAVLQKDLLACTNTIQADQFKLTNNNNQLETYRKTFVIERERPLHLQEPKQESCPHCGHHLHEENYTELLETYKKALEKFNSDKAITLKAINESGVKLKQENSSLDMEIAKLTKEKETFEQQIQDTKDKLSRIGEALRSLDQEKSKLMAKMVYSNESDKTKQLANEIDTIKAAISQEQTKSVDGGEIETQINQLKSDKLAIQSSIINPYITFETMKTIAKEHEQTLMKIRQAVAQTEIQSDLLTMYVETMLKILNGRLSAIFGNIKFQLIEPNIKEGSWNEVCTVLDGEVPYERTNTASQIKLGVKLIEAIRVHERFPLLPIIIDNAEAVTERQFNTNAQTICLVAEKPVINPTERNEQQWQMKS